MSFYLIEDKMLLSRTRSMPAVRCDATKKVGDFRRKVETKRSSTVKEHANKLAAIGTYEIKEVGDILKEIDEIHRDMFKNFTEKMKTTSQSFSSSAVVEPDSVFE